MKYNSLSLFKLRQALVLSIFTLCFTSMTQAEEHHITAQSETIEQDLYEDWDVSKPPGTWTEQAISTDESTWSTVDVSPDGKTIIFDMLGDIYAVSIDGGDAKALTHGIPWNFQPRFSPDGKEIVFVSDRDGADNLWVMTSVGGSPRQITYERKNNIHNPYWSPDGQWIAARKGYVSARSIPAGSIWLYHAHGNKGSSKGMVLVDRLHGETSQKSITEPAFSIDGKYLYYTQDITPGRIFKYSQNSIGSMYAIRRLDRESGKTDTQISGSGGAIRAIPSPDGQSLAFIKRLPNMNSALYIQDLRSGNTRAIYTRLDRDNQESTGTHGNYPAYAWTPDSKHIVIWAEGKIQKVDTASKKAQVIPVQINTTRMMRESLRFSVDVAPDDLKVKMLRWAQYHPKQKAVLFQALGHLYSKDLLSQKQKRLSKQQDHFEFWPSYSKDGKQVVYVSWDDQELGKIRVLPARGGRSKIISREPGHYTQPRFSPDGKHIVFRKHTGGHLNSAKWSAEPGIYIQAVKKGPARRLSRTGSDAQFSSDGLRILFTDSISGLRALVSVNLEGQDKRILAKGKNVREFRVSPDGKWLAFTEQFNAYILPMPNTDKPVELSRTMASLPLKKVSRRSGEFLHWSPDSQSLHWSNGSTLYSRELKDAFAFIDGAPESLPEPVEAGLDLSFTAQADKPSSTIALTGARIITMRNAQEEQEVLENSTLLIVNNRIAAIGKDGSLDIPASAKVFDMSGKTIIPGLVDVHAHGSMASFELTPEQNWEQYSNLAFGVTTIHDPSNDSSEIFAHAEMQRKGQVLGPRTFSTGRIIYGAPSPGYEAIIDSYDDALFHVQRLKDSGAISVKSYNQLRRDSRQQVIAAADKLGIMVVPEGGMKFQHNLNHISDGHTGVEHALPLGKIYKDVVDFWSNTDSGYTPTIGVAYGGIWGENYWYDRTEVWKNERLMRYAPRSIIEPRAMRRITAPDEHYNHIKVATEAKKLRDAGVKVNIGAHGQREGLAAHWEMWMLEQGGFTPWQALRAGTIDGAYYIGTDKDIGSLEVGKLADLAIIDGNPLDDLRRSEFVAYTMINGRLYDTTSMNELGSGKRRRQPFYFELEDGDTLPAETQRTMQEKAHTYHWHHNH